jgi:hypothetical protein|tara:strand:+ start:6699 stop:6983 length:285 start_codon:yes stop_codon:yes gene_type:complete
MANSKTNLTWHEVDVDTMSAALKKRYNEYRDLNKKAVDTKLAFQAQFITELRKQSMIEAAETMAFAYKFGKLSIAKVDVEAERPKSSAKPKFKF